MTAGRVCRVVTSSLSARLLLAGQMTAMPDVQWAVVTGDAWTDPMPGVEVHHVPMRRELAPSDLRAFVRLVRTLRRGRFRLVQTHTPKASLLGLPAARLARVPAVYTVHGAFYFAGNPRVRNVLGWLFERWCCSWARLVLVQSREDQAALPRARICPAGKIRYLGNGIDLDRFRVQPARGGTRPVVTMVSRLVTEKGCRDFFELARRLEGRADFRHVGPVEHDQSDAVPPGEIERAEEAGVTFVGDVADVRAELDLADVVVLPSYREGIPRAAMEAAATGRPVVAYDIRGVREVVPRETGLLVPRGDVAALTETVRGLCADAERRLRLGRSCAEHVRRHFSEDDVVERLRATYADLGVLGTTS